MSSLRLPWPIAAVALAAVLLSTSALGTAAANGASRVVYASHGKLMAVSATGGSPHAIGRVPANTLDISASRNGKRFALLANIKLRYPQKGSIREIYLVRPGHGLRLLRRFRSTAPLDIAISPDGRLIAFGRNSEIWTMRADGGGIRQVTDGHSVAWDPVFTADGRSIVFDRDASKRPRNSPTLFRKRIGGGPEVQLTEGEARSPAISSNGLLVYIRPEEGAVDSRVIVMGLDGSGRHTVDRFNDPVFDQNPTFSPDGRSIAFLRLWEKTGYASTYRYSVHTLSTSGRHHRKLVGGIRSSARDVPFAGHGPAGPVWIP